MQCEDPKPISQIVIPTSVLSKCKAIAYTKDCLKAQAVGDPIITVAQ
jgi:hypothetical protein